MKEFNTNFTADVKNFNNLSYEEQKLVIEKYENQIALNPSLKGFKTQTDNLRTRATTSENQRIIKDFAEGFTIDSLSDEENRQMQGRMKNATSFEQLSLIIDMQLQGKEGAGMSATELNDFLGRINKAVEVGVYSDEEGQLKADAAMKRFAPFVNTDKKPDVNVEGYTPIGKGVLVGDTMVNTYSKLGADGIREYYYAVVDPLTGEIDGELRKMTEADAVAAGLRSVDDKSQSQSKKESESESDSSGYDAILSVV